MLKEEILKVLEVYDKHNLSEKYQRYVFENGGVYFDYTYGDPDYNHKNRHLDIFEFAALLDVCETLGLKITADEIVRKPWAFEPEHLVRDIADGKIQRKLN